MATMKGRRELTSLYLDPPVLQDLRLLSATTRISIAAYLREAVDDLLSKHARELRKAKNRTAARVAEGG